MTSSPKAVERVWKKPPRIKSLGLRVLLGLALLAYVIYALNSFEIDPERIAYGMGRAGKMFGAFLKPNFMARQNYIIQGVLESMAMTVVATGFGVLFSIPLILGAAKNIAPRPIYFISRLILVVFRSLHVVILAIMFVIMFGFGPFAGLLTLIVNTVGFLGKLGAEDIENINPETLEAIKSTGASWPQQILYGVWPQIATRFAGLVIYRADQSFRQSTVIGLVGAGGIGAVLETAMGRYDYNTAGAILLVIIVLVLLGEYGSSAFRRRLV